MDRHRVKKAAERNGQTAGTYRPYYDRATAVIFVLFLFFYVVAGIFRLLDLHYELPLRLNAISHLIYCVLCMLFMFFIRHDIPNRREKMWLMICVGLFLAWQIEHIFEDVLIIGSRPIYRAFWYLYYIPILFAPIALLFSSLYSGMHRSQKLKPAWYSTFVISGILFIGICTNDLHHLAFAFPQGAENSYLYYEYRVLYFVAMGWSILLAFLSVWVLFRMSARRLDRKNRYIALIAFGAGLLYFIWWVASSGYDSFAYEMYNTPETWGLIYILSIEIFVRFGILRSNFNFFDFFEASTIPIALLDDDERMRYKTAGYRWDLTGEQMHAALLSPIMIEDGFRLHGHLLSSGRAFWVGDVRELDKLRNELVEKQKELEEENNLIQAEQDVIRRMAAADEQSRMYDKIAIRVAPQSAKIEEILHSTTADSQDFPQKIAAACIYKVYIKRLSNLVLLQHEKNDLHIFELENSLREALSYLDLNGVKTELVSDASGTYDGTALIAAFSWYQDLIEERVGEMEHVRVHLQDGRWKPVLDVAITGSRGKEVFMWNQS